MRPPVEPSAFALTVVTQFVHKRLMAAYPAVHQSLALFGDMKRGLDPITLSVEVFSADDKNVGIGLFFMTESVSSSKSRLSILVVVPR